MRAEFGHRMACACGNVSDTNNMGFGKFPTHYKDTLEAASNKKLKVPVDIERLGVVLLATAARLRQPSGVVV